jgi:cobalt-zinc-cadmium efflux system protein
LHAHDHSDGSNHSHAHHLTYKGNERRLALAAALTGLFMVAEIVGGLVSGSLALLADAGHMFADFASLVLAWFAFVVARRPADWKRSYGYDRFSVLVAFVNGLTLFVIAGWIVVEAWHRLQSPGDILGGVMLWVAVAGLAVNVVAFWLLSGADGENLNMQAAALHVAGDLLGSVAAIAAAVVILWTGWTPIDPLLSVLVALIILRSAWAIVAASGHILLEGTPTSIDPRNIAARIQAEFSEIEDVHHVHAWSISQERTMVTLHVRLSEGVTAGSTVEAVKSLLRDEFGVEHATVELEWLRCADDADAPGHQHALQ